MSANIQLLVQLIRSREVLIQVDQSTKDVKDAYDSFILLLFCFQFYSCSQTPCANGLLSSYNYKTENVGAHICLFDIEA